MRKGMSVVEVCVAGFILLVVFAVLTTGVLQVFGSSQVETERLQRARQQELLEIRALRSGVPLGTVVRGSIEGDVRVEPTLVGLVGVGLAHRGDFVGRFVAGGEGRVVLALPEPIATGWTAGTAGSEVLAPDEMGTIEVVAGEPFEVRWSQAGVEELSIGWPQADQELAVAVSQGRPLRWAPVGGRWARTGTGEQVLAVDTDTTRFGWARDLGLLGAGGMILFGIGFLYLNEGERPGSLDEVHLGGALLLALNYSLFFALGLTLLIATELPPALVLAGSYATAAPLLAWHLVHLTEPRFAGRRALPWALATWMLVAIWITLPAVRTLAALLLGVGILAFVTLTYGTYRLRREAVAADRLAVANRKLRQGRVERARRSLSHTLALQPGRMDHAEETLRLMPAGLGAARGRVARALDDLELWNQRASVLLRVEGEVGSDEEVVALVTALERAEARVTRASGEVDEALEGLEELVMETQEALQEALFTCLQAADDLRATRFQGAVLTEVQALQARVESGEHDLIRLVHEASELTRRLRSAERTPRPGEVHCLACGAEHHQGSRYCAGCGRERPPPVVCGGCGTPCWVPAHLLPQGWAERGLHCGRCGSALALSPAGPPPSTGCPSDLRSSRHR